MVDELRWVVAESRDEASKTSPLGFVLTGRSVVDRRTGKTTWEAVRMLPEIGKVNTSAQQVSAREEEGLGQTEDAPVTTTGVLVVGGVMVVAVLGYLAYEYAVKDWLKDDEPEAKA